MEILKIIFEIIFSPRSFFESFLRKDLPLKIVVVYVFILNSIGPVLSFYSMHILEKIPLEKTVEYCVSTYILDIVSIVIFSLLFYAFEKRNNLVFFIKLFSLAYTPIWISDIADINQYLRPLSTLGLFYSIYILYTIFLFMDIFKTKIVLYLLVFVILYILDAALAETIVKNPFLMEFLK